MGCFTKRTAEAWLREALDQARRGTLPGLVRTDATFAVAAAEYLRDAEHFTAASSPRPIAARIRERLAGRASRIVNPARVRAP